MNSPNPELVNECRAEPLNELATASGFRPVKTFCPRYDTATR